MASMYRTVRPLYHTGKGGYEYVCTKQMLQRSLWKFPMRGRMWKPCLHQWPQTGGDTDASSTALVQFHYRYLIAVVLEFLTVWVSYRYVGASSWALGVIVG